MALHLNQQPQGEERCDWNIETDDELKAKYIAPLEAAQPLDANTEIKDFDVNGFLCIRNRKDTEKQSEDVNM